MEKNEFVALDQVAGIVGAKRRTIGRLITQGELVAVVHPLNRRKKLVHRDDVERLKQTIRHRAELAT